MSASAEKQTRRDIRRAFGPEALDLIGKQGHLISSHEDSLALLKHTVASHAADIALLQAQLVAAGFGTTATQAEAATRELHMRMRQLQIKDGQLWDCVEELRRFRVRRWMKRLAWLVLGR